MIDTDYIVTQAGEGEDARYGIVDARTQSVVLEGATRGELEERMIELEELRCRPCEFTRERDLKLLLPSGDNVVPMSRAKKDRRLAASHGYTALGGDPDSTSHEEWLDAVEALEKLYCKLERLEDHEKMHEVMKALRLIDWMV